MMKFDPFEGRPELQRDEPAEFDWWQRPVSRESALWGWALIVAVLALLAALWWVPR